MSKNTILRAALRYAVLGYPVFPCGKHKEPLTDTGFKEATTDPKQVRAWWTKWPTACIGIATAGMVVIDRDVLDDGSKNPWPADQERRCDLAAAPSSCTPRGGRHHIFRRPEGVTWRCSQSKLAPKVDVKTEGGYIIVPPSVARAGVYSWADSIGIEEPLEALPLPPEWLAAALNAIAPPAGKGKSDLRPAPQLAEGPNSPGLLDRAERYIDRMPEAVSGQGGHDKTYAVASALVNGFGLDEETAYRLMAQRYNPRCRPKWSERELRHKVSDAASKEHDRPRGWLRDAQPETVVYAPEVDFASAIQPKGNPAKPARVRAVAEPVIVCMADVEPREIKWLWPGRVPRGRITLLVGKPKEGKSFLTIDMASRVSTGTPWPDGTECPKGSVILISVEDDPHDTIRPRLDAHGADVDKIHLIRGLQIPDANGEPQEIMFTLQDVANLEAAFNRMPDCKLVVIDPIGSFLGGKVDARSDIEVRGILAPVAQLAQRHGVAVLVVCHTRKTPGSNADEQTLGSRGFVGTARSVWHMFRDTENKARRLLLPGGQNCGQEPDGLAFSIEGQPARLYWEPDPVAMTADDRVAIDRDGQRQKPGPDPAQRAEAEKWLAEALSKGPRLANEIANEWVDQCNGSITTLKRAKKALGVESYRPEVPGPWWLRLPDKGAKRSRLR